jgi:hypothetical protein
LSVFLPTAFPNILSDGFLLDVFPTDNAVGAASLYQTLFLFNTLLIGVVRQQHITGREIGRVLIKNVNGEPPAQHLEASHFGLGGIGYEQRIWSGIERRFRTKLATPLANGTHMLEFVVQHVRHHTQYPREIAGRDLVFEIYNDNLPEGFARHGQLSLCLSPIRRRSPG